MPLLDVGADLLAQIVEVSADAIFSEDLDGRLPSWNATAERLYGWSAQEALGTWASRVLPPDAPEAVRAVAARARSGERVERFDTWHVGADGRPLAVSVTVSPLRGAGGEVVGTATSVGDIRQRVELAAELADAHRVLAEQNAALLRSNRDLQQFAYIASHDLSEPLRVMTGYVQLIEKRYGDALDDKGRRWVHHVVDGSQRMRTLIDDLLEYSRFLRTERTPEPVDMDALAAAAVARLRRASPDVDVEVAPLPAVLADRSAVESVLANLLGNAVKFRRDGGSSTVRVHARRDGRHVTLVVDDDGIGIEPRYRERVFRMFQRLHAREAYEGTGIGLAIVQQVAELHGGSAWADESPLGGARICVALPAVPEEAP